MRLTLLGLLLATLACPARAAEIEVGNYAIAANGIPYAVALAKNFFKREGANITGILSSNGGGTSMRNVLEGGVAYGEINPTAMVTAIRQGADLKIISDNVLTVGEFLWATKLDSPVKTLADLKGRKIGYTNPRSTSQALGILLVQAGGLQTTDAQLVRSGGFGEGITALNLGALDVAPIPEPLWSKFQASTACSRAQPTSSLHSTTSSASPPVPRQPRAAISCALMQTAGPSF